MKSFLYHLQINIDFKNKDFYKELMNFLGWNIIFEIDKEVGIYGGVVGFRSEKSGDLWFTDTSKKQVGDYDAIGVNHVSIGVESQKNVDEVLEFIKSKGIDPLFETPRHRPEFSASENETYYQIMFESPDKILFEIVYIGPKMQ